VDDSVFTSERGVGLGLGMGGGLGTSDESAKAERGEGLWKGI